MYVGLWQKYPEDEQATEQSLEATLIPLGEDRRPLDLSLRSHTDIYLLCEELQRSFHWGKVYRDEDHNGHLIIIGRTCNTSPADLSQAATSDLESELGTTLDRLTTEFAQAAPLICHFAKGTIDLSTAKQLLTEPPTSFVM